MNPSRLFILRPVATALTVTGRIDPARIAMLRIGMPAPAAEQTLRIGKVFLEPTADLERLAYTGIVDAFGQYRRGDWPEKYRPTAGVDADDGFREFVRAQEAASSDAARPAASDAGDRGDSPKAAEPLPASGRARDRRLRS